MMSTTFGVFPFGFPIQQPRLKGGLPGQVHLQQPLNRGISPHLSTFAYLGVFRHGGLFATVVRTFQAGLRWGGCMEPLNGHTLESTLALCLYVLRLVNRGFLNTSNMQRQTQIECRNSLCY